jgi:methionyl-tRNA formyltransferase
MTKIVFMGTPEFAVPALRALIARHEVIGVVTQPDRPAGRGNLLQQSPVKETAIAAGIPVFQPEKIRRPEAIDVLKQWQPAVYIVAAFGQILPQTVLDLPPFGSINIHASLLPRWRGATPINAAIRAGDAETGITIMKMDAGLDTGPMLSRQAIPIAPDDTAQTLHDQLAEIGAELLLETLPGYLEGSLAPQPQDDALATLAPRIKKEEGQIDWSQSAAQIERTVRAFTPWPGTYTFWNGRQLKIHAGVVGAGSADAGRVVMRDGRAAIGTAESLFFPTQVQLEGRKAVTVDEFLRGHNDFIGTTLV